MPLIQSASNKARSKNIETLIGDGYPRKQAVAIAYRVQRTAMKHHRSNSNENPSGTTVLVIGAGVALLGVAAYFMMKKPAGSQQLTGQNAPGGGQQYQQLPPPSLPATANVVAASNAVNLMRLGHQAEVTPAASWLSQFQTSVGLPATGRMDPTTRTYLNLATPAAASLPTPTILG